MSSSVKKYKLLCLPTNWGGTVSEIVQDFSKKHFNVERWVITNAGFGFDRAIVETSDSRIKKFIKIFLSGLYVFKVDVVVFSGGSTLFSPTYLESSEKYTDRLRNLLITKVFSFLQFFEMNILRMRKVIVVLIYQGDDARQADYCKKEFLINFYAETDVVNYPQHSDKLKRQQIAFLTKFADLVYSTGPDIMHVLPKITKFLPVARDTKRFNDLVSSVREKRILTIGHAPSNRLVKGTKYIEEAIFNLKQRDFHVNFMLIENVPHAKALSLYKEIDIFIDQLLVGWYGGAAVELMSLGKPTVAYIREDDLRFIPLEMKNELPIIRACPNSIEAVLENIIKMSDKELTFIGEKSKNFVEKWHDSRRVSASVELDILTILEKVQ